MRIHLSLVAPITEGRFAASFYLFVEGNVQVKQSRLDVKMRVLEQQATLQYDPVIIAQQGPKSFEKSTLV